MPEWECPMTCRDAAQQVLQSAGHPLHYREITKRAIESALWRPQGKTPERTLNAQLSADIHKTGKDATFVRTGRGTFGLRQWGTPEPPAPPKPAKKRRRAQRTYSFTDAAELVLRDTKDKQPVHYREITRLALERKLITTSGRTPEATMYAVILQEIKRAQARGERPRFVQHGRGYVGLSEWMGKGLAFQIDQHNRRVRDELRKRLHALAPEEFEALAAELLAALGFPDVEVTQRHADGGIDVRGVLVTGDVIHTRMAVQVKRWKQNVQTPVVQQVRGSLGAHEQGLIITASDFSKGAREEAARSDAVPVALMNGDQLAALLVEHGIGIEKNSYDILELGTLAARSDLAPDADEDEGLPPPPPATHIRIGDQALPIRHGKDVLVQVAEWLIAQGKLKLSGAQLPLVLTRKGGRGARRCLINDNPAHPGGHAFKSPHQLSNGLYIETHASRHDNERYARGLLTWARLSEDLLTVESHDTHATH